LNSLDILAVLSENLLVFRPGVVALDKPFKGRVYG